MSTWRRATRLAGSVARSSAVRKAKKLPGLLAVIDHPVAAIDDDQRHRDPRQRLHQRARARLHPHELVGRRFEGLDPAHLPLAHEGLQGEGFHHANALGRLLQGGENGREALEFGHDHPAGAIAELAHAHDRHGHDQEGDRSQRRILLEHGEGQAERGQRVAAERGDQNVERIAGRLRNEGLAGQEFGGMAGVVEADVHRQHLVEDLGLAVRDDVVGNPRQGHLLAVGGEALGDIDRGDRAADLPHRHDVAIEENTIDDEFHHIGGEGGGRRGDPHHHESQHIAPGMLAPLIAQQTCDQMHLPLVEQPLG